MGASTRHSQTQAASDDHRGRAYDDHVMTWDLWVDYLRTDGEGLTHTTVRNARPGVSLRVGDHVIVGNEDADPAVARVASVDDDGVVLVAVLPGPVEANRSLLRNQATAS